MSARYILTIEGTFEGAPWINKTDWLFRESVDEWLETIREEVEYYDGDLTITSVVLVEC